MMPIIKNALAESTVLHARIVVDILLERDPQPDDITLNILSPNFICSEIAELSNVYGRRER